MKPCFIHAGLGKTGTSYIQGYCQQNYANLMKHGIFYPNLGNPGSKPKTINHKEFREDGAAFPKVGQFIQKKGSIKKVILSWEAHTNENWRDNSHQFCKENKLDSKVIIYLRRQDLWIESAWKQWGVKGKHESFEAFIEAMKHKANWMSVLDFWSEKFGRENLIVRVYEQGRLHNGDLLDDFFKVIDPTYRQVDYRNKADYGVRNTGFKPPVLELISRSRSLTNGPHDNRLFVLYDKYLSDVWRKQPFGNYGLMSHEERIKLLAQYEESNQELARIYLKQDTPLFEEPQEAQTVPDARDLDLQTLSLLVSDMMLSVDKQMKIDRQKMTILGKPGNKIKKCLAAIADKLRKEPR